MILLPVCYCVVVAHVGEFFVVTIVVDVSAN